MTENRRKKRVGVVLAAGVAGVLLGGGVAWAAGATVSTTQVGAGSGTVSTCDSSWDLAFGTPVYDAGTGTYRVAAVDFSNVAAGCNGQVIAVTVVDGSNTSLADGTATIAATSGTVTLSGSVDAAVSTTIVTAIYQ